MNRVRCITTALVFITAATFVSCKSKQEAPKANTGAAPQTAGGDKSASGLNASGAIEASPKDKTDAQAAAAHVLSQLTAGEFAAVYKEASPGFKQIGGEADFVAKFQHARNKTGLLKNPRQVSLAVRPDKSLVLVYRLESERFTTDMRLTFSRSQSGMMELAGLNQHDEARK